MYVTFSVYQAVAHEKFYTAYADFWNSVINFYNWEQFNDTELVRRFSLLAKPGTSALSPEEQSQVCVTEEQSQVCITEEQSQEQ